MPASIQVYKLFLAAQIASVVTSMTFVFRVILKTVCGDEIHLTNLSKTGAPGLLVGVAGMSSKLPGVFKMLVTMSAISQAVFFVVYRAGGRPEQFMPLFCQFNRLK